MNQRQRGELEAYVLNALWDCPAGLTGSELVARFDEPQPALTTVATVLERLRAKGDVRREKNDGRGFRYFASEERVATLANEMANALTRADDRSLTLLNFAGALTESDREILRRALDRE